MVVNSRGRDWNRTSAEGLEGVWFVSPCNCLVRPAQSPYCVQTSCHSAFKCCPIGWQFSAYVEKQQRATCTSADPGREWNVTLLLNSSAHINLNDLWWKWRRVVAEWRMLAPPEVWTWFFMVLPIHAVALLNTVWLNAGDSFSGLKTCFLGLRIFAGFIMGSHSKSVLIHHSLPVKLDTCCFSDGWNSLIKY